MSDTLLKLGNILKKYAGNLVLNDVSFEVKKGEIHALIGENGAGKSTLMNILFGMPVIHSTGGFEGTVEIEGKAVSIADPRDAMELGIGMVHQEFMLIPGFTITENIKLNREITKAGPLSRVFGTRLEFLDMEAMNRDARAALDKLDMDIEEYILIAGLPVGHMQFVEIAREIDKTGIRLLVFDEPTAVLTESEAQHLLRSVRKLADDGIGIVFISHRLDEIMQVADRVTILRDGEWVATKPTSETSAAEIARLMVGRQVEIKRSGDDARKTHDEVILSVKDLEVGMPGEWVKGVDLVVKRGEIVGIGGLAGQGKLGIANGIMGVYPARGEVQFAGKAMKLGDPMRAIRCGMAFVSEDRKGVGLLLEEPIETNIAITAMQVRGDFLSRGPIRFKRTGQIREHAATMVRSLDIRCTSTLQRAGSLSGGNQQKVCIARALTLQPELLFVSEPTRGIDIGAKKLVMELLEKLNRDTGMTIVMTSSELAELRSICDRIAIVVEGKIAGVLSPTAPEAEYGLMMSGAGQSVQGGAQS